MIRTPQLNDLEEFLSTFGNGVCMYTRGVGEIRNTLSARLIQHRFNIRHKIVIHTLDVWCFLKHGIEALKNIMNGLTPPKNDGTRVHH